MRIHFIAIGGAAMHNLAIALNRKGYLVSGSDDKIFDPSKSRLEKEGILPEEMGWFPENIDESIEAIILGMHAREDNPELLKAKELGLKIFSYPEYLYEQSKAKKRVVIGGSHGKTSITAMILHVLQDQGIDCDYMVGAQLDGFDCMVKLSDAPLIVLEGDEYLSSPIDRRPKFHLYRPHLAVLTGIAWDHINVFPTFENYVEQFRIFVESIEKNGALFYFGEDKALQGIAQAYSGTADCQAYNTHAHDIRQGVTYLQANDQEYTVRIFGKHNLQNLNAACHVCCSLGLSAEQFYSSIASFGGAARRLELVKETSTSVLYKDFAHSPSKLKATTEALKEQFPNRKLVACMELHTFSSLNKAFLNQYEGSMAKADIAMVFFDPAVVEQKRLAPITTKDISDAFGGRNVQAYEDVEEMLHQLQGLNWSEGRNLLMMSSGNFKGLDLHQLAEKLFT